MEKINRKALKEASDRLYIAWGMLVHFNCRDIVCDDCPMQCDDGRCAAGLLGEMYLQADKRAKEAEHDNH